MSDGGPSGLGRLRATLSSSTLEHPRARSRLAITLVAGIVALVAAVAVGRNVVSSPAPTPRPAPAPSAAAPTPVPVPVAPAPAPAADPPGYVRFRDARTGFSIAYPKGWSRVASREAAVKLLVAKGRATSLLVRVARSPVTSDVTRETLPIVRQLTDSLVRADGRIQSIVEPQPLVLAGLPGYRYVYTFATTSGGSGAHIHYFLFKGRRIITLVLQALPAQRLEQDLPLLKRIAETFRARVP